MKKDSLGDRMKCYESVLRHKLMKRSYTIVRIDGKAFHTYTRGLQIPFDEQFMNDMDDTAMYLCKNLQGCKLAYIQSDEISLLITDFDSIETQLLFNGNIQKIVSVSASLATAKFNQLRLIAQLEKSIRVSNDGEVLLDDSLDDDDDVVNFKLAHFDSRVFQLPTKTEVENYFIWRQQDATRNSIQSVAYSLYSHKECDRKDCNELQEMIFQKGINWDDYGITYKRGRVIYKGKYDYGICKDYNIPIFTQERDYLQNIIPNNL